ncbi:MAG: PH domain-containing protein [Cetobacterium sp.]
MHTKPVSVFLTTKVDSVKAIDKFEEMLLDSEKVELGYIATRDRLIFTDKRILIINVQGLTGKKVDFHTIPYSKISSFSVETSGTFDLDSELKIWVSGLAGIEIKFLKGINIKEIGQFITSKII